MVKVPQLNPRRSKRDGNKSQSPLVRNAEKSQFLAPDRQRWSMPSCFRSAACWARGFVLILVLAGALLVGACSEEDEDIGRNVGSTVSRDPRTPIVVPAGEPIIIGVSVALTGPTASLGLESRDAVIVGIERWKAANGDQIRGHDIEVYAEDDGCFEADVTAFAAGRLLQQQGLVGVIGPMCSDGARAAIPIYAEAGIVMVSGSATRTDLTLTQPEPKFFFRTAYTNAAGRAVARSPVSIS